MIDLRELLKKYIDAVQAEEGTSFIPLRYADPVDHSWWRSLTREEIISTVSEILKRFDRPAATTYLAYHPIEK